MIATAGSTLYALERLENLGVHPSRTTLVSILGSAEGIKRIKTKCPYVNLILGGEDPALNAKKFIVPGLGDFGDRYFGT
jgi:uracil phosphoribosyltransferase